MTARARWLAFAILCLGDLMIVLDSTIVNVALPTIRGSLGFSEASLVWVVNAYLLTYGGFMLLGGRLADLYGHRRVFIVGSIAFTLASLACGLAPSQALLVVARAVQGVGGAVVSAVAMALIMDLFAEGPQRVRAMGYFGFILAGGGSIGVLLGGVLTSAFDWRSIFLVNLPIGALVVWGSMRLLPVREIAAGARKLDIAGAVTVTLALLLAVYAIINGDEAGWTSVRTLGMLGGGILLMAAFLAIEARAHAPLVPLGLFRLRNLAAANVIAVLWAAGLFAWFFLSALYMQQALGYSPLQVGLAFLPANLIMGAFSYSLSAKLVNRFGIPRPLAWGLAFASAGLAWFGFAPAGVGFAPHILPGMLLLGLGGGMAFNPVLLAAMNDVGPQDSGLASGIVNTSFMMGGSLGLAILAAVAAARTNALAVDGLARVEALTGGYNAAFLAGAAFTAVGALIGATLVRTKPAAQGDAEAVAPAVGR